jgi:hypothetical protein
MYLTGTNRFLENLKILPTSIILQKLVSWAQQLQSLQKSYESLSQASKTEIREQKNIFSSSSFLLFAFELAFKASNGFWGTN